MLTLGSGLDTVGEMERESEREEQMRTLPTLFIHMI